MRPPKPAYALEYCTSAARVHHFVQNIVSAFCGKRITNPVPFKLKFFNVSRVAWLMRSPGRCRFGARLRIAER